MPNIATLFSGRNNDEDDADSLDESNSRFVGGLDGRGGGSGLAVLPSGDDRDPRAAILGRAQQAGADDGDSTSRRTITMYRDGFTVDDGPYRRLDDPANAEFLRSLAMGRTPRELVDEGTDGNVTVGLVDKRNQEYVETFRSFSGAGSALGSTTAPPTNGVIDPSQPPPTAPAAADGATTSVQVRLISGKRLVLKVPVTGTVLHLVNEIISSGDAGSDPFLLMGGFPPRQITDWNATIKESGLAGAAVTQKKA